MNEPRWRDQVAPYEVTFAAAASVAALAALERDLEVALPPELQAFLAESNGLVDRYGTSVVWSTATIAEQNQEFRTRRDFRDLYMPFDAMFFFGEAGNGDQFFYRILNGAVPHADIYLWDHENDGRIWRAPGLGRFLREVLARATGD